MNQNATIEQLTDLAVRFRDERDWKQFHNPKDMALSLCLETAELAELMQWKNGQELIRHLQEKKQDLGDELSDVLYWVLVMARDLGIDLGEAFEQKMVKNARKYPVEKARGVAKKSTEL